ncbi:hypothetical protein G3A_12170 [Bacillus sp. 17376]|uniref:Uncharacterized protein n=1 Tax=Mesobacillus boroniphilus JCM 21738 TaxID=1294265 RepID=W4RJX6_9BACI|nr:hypothetical protein [Mesobacillus boroniphilus]ESU32212.1 hypothetical protein G3A_12170 [Bacillus sp. 17376]GAE43884.1 hypothetical protein JCM21738_554 [Mesobacillus boroniphilus JCM 21738]
MMIDVGVIIVLILSLWFITITLQKLADRIMEKQEKQYELLKEIKDLLKKEK